MTRPLGIAGVLPANLVAGRLLVVLVCYLDDSGKDSQNPITTLAGYAAPEAVWKQFEAEVEPLIQERVGDRPIHAMDLYRGEAPYTGWRVLNKQAFVADACRPLYAQKPVLAVSFSVRKASYAVRAVEAVKRGFRKRTITPYTFCMQAILNWLLTDVEVGKMANEAGVSLILETGNEHNDEAKQSVDWIKAHFGLKQLKALAFVDKGDCRAIQMADLFAFYSRRHNRFVKAPGMEPATDPVLRVLLEGVRQRSFIATDFGPDIKESRFMSRPDMR